MIKMYKNGNYEISEATDDVPIPPPYESKYIWLEKMNIGNSVLTKNIKRTSLAMAIARFAKKTGFKYKQQKEGDTIRVWRIQ